MPRRICLADIGTMSHIIESLYGPPIEKVISAWCFMICRSWSFSNAIWYGWCFLSIFRSSFSTISVDTTFSVLHQWWGFTTLRWPSFSYSGFENAFLLPDCFSQPLLLCIHYLLNVENSLALPSRWTYDTSSSSKLEFCITSSTPFVKCTCCFGQAAAMWPLSPHLKHCSPVPCCRASGTYFWVVATNGRGVGTGGEGMTETDKEVSIKALRDVDRRGWVDSTRRAIWCASSNF